MSEPQPSSTPPEVIDLTNLDSESESEDDQQQIRQAEPLDENAHTQLHMAIASLDPVVLRQTLADLIDDDPYIARAIYDRLGTSSSVDEGSEREDLGEPDKIGGPTELPLPRRPGQEGVATIRDICLNCDEDFDTLTERVDGECQYHPGRLEVDEESFVDWNEEAHGPMDTERNRTDFPQNFFWSCCDEDSHGEGCRAGVHEIGGHNKKRAKLDRG